MLLWGSIWRVHVPGRPLPLCRTQIQWPYYPRQKFNKGYSTNFPKKENSRCQEWGKIKSNLREKILEFLKKKINFQILCYGCPRASKHQDLSMFTEHIIKTHLQTATRPQSLRDRKVRLKNIVLFRYKYSTLLKNSVPINKFPYWKRYQTRITTFSSNHDGYY